VPRAPSAAREAGGTVHKTCPKAARRTAKSHAPDAAQLLLPTGARSVLLCRYHGANPLPRYQTLARAQLVARASTVGALERHFNASQPFRDGIFLCPRDVGEKAVAFFRYADGSEVPLVLRIGGCPTVSNGKLRLSLDYRALRTVLRLTR